MESENTYICLKKTIKRLKRKSNLSTKNSYLHDKV